MKKQIEINQVKEKLEGTDYEVSNLKCKFIFSREVSIYEKFRGYKRKTPHQK